MTNREIFAKMTLTCAKVAKLQKEQNEAIEVIKDCFCKTGIMYHPANEPPPETEPKYDPCRKFRKGDKVRLVEYKGRQPFDCENYEPETAGQLCIVAEDDDAESVHLLHVWKIENKESEPNNDEREWHAFPLCSIELVTPVEELAPYFVQELLRGWAVYKDTQNDEDEICIYWNENHPNAKAAAEAECARLNAEYRKEMEK